VIEDNATLGGLIVALLREEGYRSLRAWSLHEAVRLSRDRRPDALVLELGLPYREGLPLIGELRAQDGLETAPILVVTGNQLDLRPDEASQIEEVMTKPVDIDRLINRVRRALGDPEYAIPEKGYGAGYDPSLSTW
jgi:DNA-binding response OmpR family regulator